MWRGQRGTLQTIMGLARLVRLSNSIPAALLVFLGARLAGAELHGKPIWQAAFVMWTITAFGYLSNDLFDLVEDRINKPERPLASGAVSTGQALLLALFLGGLALLSAVPLGWIAFAIAAVVLTLLLGYNAWWKATPGGGNVLIALLAGAALFPGSVGAFGWTTPALLPLFLPASILSSFIAARELLKTLEDRTGDYLAGKQTISNVIGVQRTLHLIALLAIITTILSLLPLTHLHYSWAYLFCIIVGVDLPLLIAVGYCYRNIDAIGQDGRQVRRVLALLKGAYFAGLLALLLA